MELSDVFADNLRIFRERKALSQLELSNRCGMHRTSISGMEQGAFSPNITRLGGIARALGVEPLDLLTPGGQSRCILTRADAAQLRAGETALCKWLGAGEIALYPLEIADEDITLRVVCMLIEQGYSDAEVVERYRSIEPRVRAFVQALCLR